MKGDKMAIKKTIAIPDVTGFPVEHNLPEGSIKANAPLPPPPLKKEGGMPGHVRTCIPRYP